MSFPILSGLSHTSRLTVSPRATWTARDRAKLAQVKSSFDQMPIPVLVAKQISKAYKLGKTHSTDTLRDRIGQILGTNRGKAESGILWALKDTSFEIFQGEVVGLIGRNGAGKSTLLKVISQITELTSGELRIRGRVASLMDVGTGFHPELSGRENLFLNGSILGMRLKELIDKYDEIVDYANLEGFMDTPVKRYSTGMRVRLAFSIAAHLDPDILLVDEVLAVGDAEFQKKCMGKMRQVSDGGRTVILVSHDMAAVSNLCSRGIVLDRGQIQYTGPIREAVSKYLTTVASSGSTTYLHDRSDRAGNGKMRFTQVTMLGPTDEPAFQCMSGDNIKFRLHYESKEILRKVWIGLMVHNETGLLVAQLSNYYVDDLFELAPIGYVDCQIPRMPLTSGTFGNFFFFNVLIFKSLLLSLLYS